MEATSVVQTRRCPSCDTIKSVSHFGINKSRKDGLSYHCLFCKASQQRALNKRQPEQKRQRDLIWRNRNKAYKNAQDRKRYHLGKDVFRERNLKALYGISISEYNILLESQGGRCAVCRKTQTDNRGRHFFVDHCHSTGRIRGLLCYNCNSAIGMAHDDIELLKKLTQYLEHHAE